jgi:competence protein ComEC
LHVTMIAALAGWLMASVWRRLPRHAERLPARQAGLIAAVLAALGYALLAGFQVPAQRTLFMLIVLALAFWGRREPRPFSALIVALFVVLLVDPWAVLSAGFWLSFGAMAAILWVSFGRVALPDKLRGWVTVQWAVTLALAPVLFLLFQQVSLISPLANAVAIPLVSWLVTPLALLGVLIPPLWQVAAWLMAWLGPSIGEQPPLAVVLPAPGWGAALALAGTVWMLLPRGFPLRGLGLLLWLPLLFPLRDAIAPDHFRVEAIDVGQGTAVLLRTANHALLYDTGASFADSDSGERIIVPFLRASGIGRLSGLIISHDDTTTPAACARCCAIFPPAGCCTDCPPPAHCLTARFLRAPVSAASAGPGMACCSRFSIRSQRTTPTPAAATMTTVACCVSAARVTACC